MSHTVEMNESEYDIWQVMNRGGLVKLAEELALTKHKLEEEVRISNERGQAIEQYLAEMSAMSYDLKAAEQAIRESQQQDIVAYISKFKYYKKSKAEIITREDRSSISDMFASGYDFTPLYAKPVIIPESALQLHIKELRELLADAAESVQEWGNYADDYFKEKWDLAGDVEKYNQASLAKQPDTRALDKALLEAEIEVLETWCHHEKHGMADPQYMLENAQAKLAELNKE